MCCIKRCCKLGCKCIKWVLITVVLLVVIALVITIIVVAVALNGTETLQKILQQGINCVSGKDCPSGPGLFYQVVKPYIKEDTYKWECNYTMLAVPRDGHFSAGWGFEFTMGDNDALGIELVEVGGHDANDFLTAYFNFFDSTQELGDEYLDEFSLKDSFVRSKEILINFQGDVDLDGDNYEAKRKCWENFECPAKLQKIGAHFLLKFDNVPDWLCLKFDSDNIGFYQFLQDFAKTIGKVWKDAQTAIESITVTSVSFPIDKVSSANAEYSAQLRNAAKTCPFSKTADRSDARIPW